VESKEVRPVETLDLPDVPPSLGNRRVQLNLGWCSIAFVRHEPYATYRPHAHARTCVALVLAGGFEEHVDRRVRDADAGTVHLMPAGITHTNHISHVGARALLVDVDPETESWREGPLLEWQMIRLGPPGRVLLRLAQIVRTGGGDDPCEIEELVLQALESLGVKDEPRRPPSRLVKRALEWLHAPHPAGVRLGDAAREIGTDPAYLARAFRRRMGCTMGAYLRRLRVRRAAALIVDQRLRLADAAACAGFADQSHLTRVFKCELGLTPNRFRQLGVEG
jgi:AraC family transcriptional regulator